MMNIASSRPSVYRTTVARVERVRADRTHALRVQPLDNPQAVTAAPSGEPPVIPPKKRAKKARATPPTELAARLQGSSTSRSTAAWWLARADRKSVV